MYSIDTSALVDGWVRYYPPKNFPALWGRIEQLIVDARVRASKEVLLELEKQDDDLHKWAKERAELFVEISDPVQDAVTQLMDSYYDPEKPHKGISGADPFVIGVAMTENPKLTVVSGENPGSAENPKIPFVCDYVGLKHISFLGLIQEQGWTF